MERNGDAGPLTAASASTQALELLVGIDAPICQDN